MMNLVISNYIYALLLVLWGVFLILDKLELAAPGEKE